MLTLGCKTSVIRSFSLGTILSFCDLICTCGLCFNKWCNKKKVIYHLITPTIMIFKRTTVYKIQHFDCLTRMLIFFLSGSLGGSGMFFTFSSQVNPANHSPEVIASKFCFFLQSVNYEIFIALQVFSLTNVEYFSDTNKLSGKCSIN